MKKINLLYLLLIWLAIPALSYAQPNVVWLTSEDNSKHFMQPFDEHGAPCPTIQSLADEGLLFTHAFSNAPVCSAARSTLISGCYGPRIGSHYHRNEKAVHLPEGLEAWPTYMRAAGYYCTNNYKQDYNINIPDINTVWDESSRTATWQNRQPNQPFFHVQNYHGSHESELQKAGTSGTTITDQNTIFIPPTQPNTPLFRYTYAKYNDLNMKIDDFVKEYVDKLKAEGLLESTFVFYYGDHGGVVPGTKGYLYETGLHVPLVVRIPENYREEFELKAGTKVDGFVSFVDFAATVLDIAGIAVPEQMDGKPFLSRDMTLEEINKRDSTFSFADRFDEKYDMVRAYRKGKMKYIRNYEPFNPDALHNNYRYSMAAYKQWREMYHNGELNEIQASFFKRKKPEMLYDVEADPYETNNLAADPAYADVLLEMRNTLTDIVKDMPDLGFYPEAYILNTLGTNAVAAGLEKKEEIQHLVDISNYSIYPFEDIRTDLLAALNSTNQWYRYWGLIVCSSHFTEDEEIIAIAKTLAESDNNKLVRMRAMEYLALIKEVHPKTGFLNLLSEITDKREAMLTLNSLVMLMDSELGYSFPVTSADVTSNVSNNDYVKARLSYLGEKELEVCDTCEQIVVDSDYDGVGDDEDGCSNDANKTSPGECGCGTLETHNCEGLTWEEVDIENGSFEQPADDTKYRKISLIPGWSDDAQVDNGNGREAISNLSADGSYLAYIGQNCGVMYNATNVVLEGNTAYRMQFQIKRNSGDAKLIYSLGAYDDDPVRREYLASSNLTLDGSVGDWTQVQLDFVVKEGSDLEGKKLTLDFDVDGFVWAHLDDVRLFKANADKVSALAVNTLFALNVYPTIARHYITIQGASLASEVSVFNLLGHQCDVPTIQTNKLDIRGLVPGVYVLQIVDGDVKEIKRFIKE